MACSTVVNSHKKQQEITETPNPAPPVAGPSAFHRGFGTIGSRPNAVQVRSMVTYVESEHKDGTVQEDLGEACFSTPAPKMREMLVLRVSMLVKRTGNVASPEPVVVVSAC